MTGASKILTVSYGTFSCTLEGFDDPFSTMKAIAEYFRDLAADDRYFGAEPPTPDAAMLHKIAEREIQRRVEAKISENSVVLRAAEGAGTATHATLTIPAANPRAESVAPAVTAEAAVQRPIEPVSPPVAVVAEPVAAGESVAEKLARIRAEAAQATATITAAVLSAPIPAEEDEEDKAVFADPAPALPEPAPTAASDEATDALLADLMADLGGGTALQAAPDAVAETVASDHPADVAALPSDEAPVVADAIATEVETDLADLIAEPTQDMDMAPEAEAVALPESVAMAAEEGTEDDAATPDFDLAALTARLAAPEPAATEADAELPEDTLEAVTEDASAEPTETAAPIDAAEGAEDSFAADLAAALEFDAESAATPAPELHEDPLFESEPVTSIFADADEADDMDSARADIAPQSSADDEPTAEALPQDVEAAVDLRPEPQAQVEAEAEPEMGAAGQDDAPAQTDMRPEAAAKLQRARARVIRIRRGEAPVDAAMPADAALPQAAEDALEQALKTEPAPRPVAAVEAPILSPEAEADLEAELAALRAEMALPAAPLASQPVAADVAEPMQPGEPAAPVTAVIPAPALAAPAPAPVSPPVAPVETATAEAMPARRSLTDQATDDAVSRLMAQADEVMEGPENKRRLSAIAHLKAAVAATVADRTAGADLPSPQTSRLARYRDDLAMVVRAKLGVGPALGADRPAPLMLVSEQRVDRAVAAPAAAAMPAAEVAPPAPAVAAPVAPAAPALAEVAPVRPRRVVPVVRAVEEDSAEDADETVDAALVDARGFTEFADRLGARSLPELIEASAAYLAVVQKRDAFSRPQLMANVEAALPGELPREDGLRSFGALLRSGRLSKLRRGQFVLTPQSNYLTEGKRIAG